MSGVPGLNTTGRIEHTIGRSRMDEIDTAARAATIPVPLASAPMRITCAGRAQIAKEARTISNTPQPASRASDPKPTIDPMRTSPGRLTDARNAAGNMKGILRQAGDHENGRDEP